MQILNYLDPELLIKTLGVIGLFAIIFAESGLLIGFFFPGDSLLFTAGFLAPILGINIFYLVIGVFICAFLGDNVGYWFGKKVGPKLFTKDDSLIFKKENVVKTQEFFNKYGAKAIFLARFVPVVRTFTPILAGVGQMKYATFIKWNILGAFVWGVGITLAGYYLGTLIPNSEKYLSIIVGAVVILSVLPIAWEIWKGTKK